MNNKKIAIYPGSFDPLHQGHIQIIKKALKLFDFLYVIVSFNPDKNNQSDIQKRFNDVKDKLKDFSNIKVLKNTNRFTAEIANDLNANFIIRSARNINDFNYELELAAGNKKINDNLETILIVPDYDFINYSSTLLRHSKWIKENEEKNV